MPMFHIEHVCPSWYNSPIFHDVKENIIHQVCAHWYRTCMHEWLCFQINVIPEMKFHLNRRTVTPVLSSKQGCFSKTTKRSYNTTGVFLLVSHEWAHHVSIHTPWCKYDKLQCQGILLIERCEPSESVSMNFSDVMFCIENGSKKLLSRSTEACLHILSLNRKLCKISFLAFSDKVWSCLLAKIRNVKPERARLEQIEECFCKLHKQKKNWERPFIVEAVELSCALKRIWKVKAKMTNNTTGWTCTFLLKKIN